MPTAEPPSVSEKATRRINRNRYLFHRRRPYRRISLLSKIVTLAAIAATTTTGKISTVRALQRHASSAFVAAAWGSTNRSFFASSDRRFTTKRNMVSSCSLDVPKNLRGLFGGSGVEGMSNPLMNEQILDLLPPPKKRSLGAVNVLYLGTATYDIRTFRDKQTARFRDHGCSITSLDVATTEENIDGAKEAIRSADIILVSGGNTLFAVDRWTHLGLVPHLRAAMERGCVLTGGSAGAICWFDSGHSDSADPDTYRKPMMTAYDKTTTNEDESSEYDPDNKKEWRYLRVPGLGFVPGPFVCCPHHDRVQSNGLLRAHDFDRMLLARAQSSQKSVLGIGIDHYAALVVEGENYKVYVLPDKAGSVSQQRNDGGPVFDVDDDGTANGVPGIWIKRVLVGSEETRKEPVVEAMLCPSEGKLADLLKYGGDNLPEGNEIENDDNQIAVETCRKENPSGILQS